ncbi:MAG: hypothetical protein ACM3X4_04950 [Ignavibacteriales bacterium]
MPDRLRKRPAKDRAAFDAQRLQYEVGEELDEGPKTTGPETPGTKGRTPGIPDKDRDVKKS